MSDQPTWLYRLVVPLFQPVLRRIWSVECEGLEHVCCSGGLIIAVNHRSWADPPLAGLTVYPMRYPRFVGKEELFRNPIFGWFLRQGGAIPLDRRRPDVAAVRAAVGVLERGGCLILFPEGTRSRTGIPGRPRPGVGFMARKAGVPVVPARVWNTEQFPWSARLKIKFGPPLFYSGGGEKKDDQAFAYRVMDAIFEL